MAESVGPALFLVQEILSFLKSQKGHLERDLQEEIQGCEMWLTRLGAYLGDTESGEGSELLKNQVKEIRDVSYDIKEVLDISMLHMPHQHHRHEIFNRVHNIAHGFWHRDQLLEISSRMKKIKSKIEDIIAFSSSHIGNTAMEQRSGSGSGSWTEHQEMHVPEDGEIIGLERPSQELIHQLKNGESRCLTISVVGPGGSGKTTLVKLVYDSYNILESFDCHAWVSVSHSFIVGAREKLLGNMLVQFCASREEPIPSGNIDSGAKLRGYLQRKRYFVVLDDVCNKNQWECIKNALPNGNGSCRSRIIVTTRNLNVASYCLERGSTKYKHDLSNGLPWPDAWNLFCMNAFRIQDGKCPRELEEWSEKIVKKCEGSPLAIVKVGCLLSDGRSDPREWKKFHDNLRFEIKSNQDLLVIKRMLLSSYEDLPRKYKGCFLYFSIFPEDCSIKRGRLIRLWSAERLVLSVGDKTREDVAGEHLDELITRNLVHVNKWDFDERARSCRLRNLMLEFIVHESEEEDFVLIVSETKMFSRKIIRRLSVHNTRTTLAECGESRSVRSAFFFRWDNCSLQMMEETIRNCHLLSVLDLEGAPLEKFPEDIVNLILLKYLSLKDTKIKVIPQSIKKLSLLETLDLRRTGVTKLPKNILYLRLLRHLLVYVHKETTFMTFDTVKPVKMFSGIRNLRNLQKLSLVSPHKNFKIVKELESLTQLRKLGLILVKDEDATDLCSSVGKMVNLRTLDVSTSSKEDHLALEGLVVPPCHLERLYLKGRLMRFPTWISKLDNLYRIGVKWSRLNTNPLQTLQDLCNLTELEMLDACTEGELIFKAGKFSKLKILHIEQFDRLDTVKIEEGAMSHLQKLTLRKCAKLTLPPLGIHHLSRLEELLLYAMPEEFITRIENEDREMVLHIPFIQSSTLTESQCWVSRKLLS